RGPHARGVLHGLRRGELRVHQARCQGDRRSAQERPRAGVGQLRDPLPARLPDHGAGPGAHRRNDRLHAQARRQGDPRLSRRAGPQAPHAGGPDRTWSGGPRRVMETVGVAVKVFLAGILLLAATPTVAAAPPLDGSSPMRCAIQTVMACNQPSVCVRGTSATINLPPALVVDVGQRLIGGSATGRTVKMTQVDRDGGRLLLHGVESGLAGISWNMVIVETSGAMSGSVLGHGGGGFLIFGACSAASSG